MRLFLVACAAFAACLLCMTSARAEIVFRDSFDDGDVKTNVGPEAIGDDQPWVPTFDNLQNDGPGPGWDWFNFPTESGGAVHYSPLPNDYSIAPLTGSRIGAWGGPETQLAPGPILPTTAPGTTFRYVTSNMQVSTPATAPSRDTETDIIGSGDGSFRFQFGIIDSASIGWDLAELYSLNGAGIFVELYKDNNDNPTISGAIRAQRRDSIALGGADAETTVGVKTLGAFTLPGYDGVGELTTEVTLVGNQSYDLAFKLGDVELVPSVTFGALSGAIGAFDDGDPDPAVNPFFLAGQMEQVQLTVYGQNWQNGRGSGDLNLVEVARVPEPSTLALLSLAALFAARRRR